MAVTALGRHILVELWYAKHLDRPDHVERALVEAVRVSGGTLLDVRVVPFPNGAASGVAIIAESHISIHTWPEHRYVAADVFTCSERMDPDAAVRVLAEAFEAERVDTTIVPRGVLPAPVASLTAL